MRPLTYALCLAGAASYQLDTVITAPMVPPANCPYGCANWANLRGSHNTYSQDTMDSLWRDVKLMDTTQCAIPAGIDVPMGGMCWCAGIPADLRDDYGYCSPPTTPYPMQVNLQFGVNGDELQVAFVTEDFGLPLINPPLVEVCGTGGSGCVNVTGKTTRAPEPQNPEKVMSYSFIVLPTSLTLPGASLTYRCRPGTVPALWSETFPLSIPQSNAVRTYALYGDQGLYPYSSVGNLIDDQAAGKIDGVLMLGDISYNMEMSNGTRGDGYMYAMEAVLSRVPWVTVMGNHEIEGSPFGSYCSESVYCEGRYLNQTAGYLRAGENSGSNTNLYFSLDLGLMHMIVLNTMPYLNLRDDLRVEQLAWLEKDLKAANAQREKVPWIVIATHVPMYCSANGQTGVGGDSKKDLELLLQTYGVDLYTYGHVHSYESTWPVYNNKVRQPPSLVNPQAPVHLLTGAGGPPGGPDTYSAPAPFTRFTYSSWSYGHITVYNHTHLQYTHFANPNGTVVDSFTIVQESHGPFPLE